MGAFGKQWLVFQMKIIRRIRITEMNKKAAKTKKPTYIESLTITCQLKKNLIVTNFDIVILVRQLNQICMLYANKIKLESH